MYPDREIKKKFQSTPSVGRATPKQKPKKTNKGISIHALRGEGDLVLVSCALIHTFYFNPRPPWGGRRLWLGSTGLLYRFQSTPSVGRATSKTYQTFFPKFKFQSTPSVGRATPPLQELVTQSANFNPRPPWGGRPPNLQAYTLSTSISIHALRGEGDL